jgi:hypothetical protein
MLVHQLDISVWLTNIYFILNRLHVYVNIDVIHGSFQLFQCTGQFSCVLHNVQYEKKYGLIGKSNTEKIRLPVVQYGKNNVRSHVLNGCF